MMLFGLQETALIALIGISVLLFPRIVPRISRWIGGRHAAYKIGERSPADDAEQVYQVASPALQQSSQSGRTISVIRRLLRTAS